MIRWIVTIIVSFLLCGLLTNDIPTMIAMTPIIIGFFVGIIWELILHYTKDKGV
jgi:hypothetical protein